MLYRLLEEVPKEHYCLISVGREGGNATQALPASLYQLITPVKGWERFAALSDSLAVKLAAWQVKRRAQQIERIMLDERCRVLVACSGDLLDIPAGAVAAQNVQAAFVPYFFDDYLYQWTSWKRKVAHVFERKSMRTAASAIVPNEFLANEYYNRYGIECQIIRNPCLVQQDSEICKQRGVSGRPKIVYTGSVYHAHYDAFRNLVSALALQPIVAELHIYTAQSPEELNNFGIEGPQVHIWGHVSQAEALKVQKEADILFLPLAFLSDIHEVVRTSAPGKMGEYLSSGVPILVHAPPDSFMSWYFREHGCGVVVDSDDVRMLRHAIEQLCGEEHLRQQVCRAALRQSFADYSIDVSRSSFYEILESAGIGTLESYE